MKAVPIFVIEEHHEAYYIWHYAIRSGILPEYDNALLHFDEHADMASPKFNRKFNTTSSSLNDLKTFVYKHLGIDTFIVPAIHDRIFKSVHWIQSRDNITMRNVELFIQSIKNEGKKFIITEKFDKVQDNGYAYLPFLFSKRGCHDYVNIESNYVLDIDLDYFSCVADPYELHEIRIEVTETQYLDFNSNDYHILKLLDSRVKFESMTEDRRFFLILNRCDEPYMSSLKVDQRTIDDRVEGFYQFLKRIDKRPWLITICRSNLSGFTPLDQTKVIEERVKEVLSSLFILEYLRP